MFLVSLFSVMNERGQFIPCFKLCTIVLILFGTIEIRLYVLFLQESKFKRFVRVIVIVMKVTTESMIDLIMYAHISTPSWMISWASEESPVVRGSGVTSS